MQCLCKWIFLFLRSGVNDDILKKCTSVFVNTRLRVNVALFAGPRPDFKAPDSTFARARSAIG